jgi:hypothetical protein
MLNDEKTVRYGFTMSKHVIYGWQMKRDGHMMHTTYNNKCVNVMDMIDACNP